MRDPDEPYFVSDKTLRVQEIDLNCLDAEEAQAIGKQKIFDIAQVVHQSKDFKHDYVLAILCAADHIFYDQTEDSDYADDLNESSAYSNANNGRRNKRGYLERNIVLDMIRDELQMDHHYLPDHKIVLVRIDQHTINNPVLADW